MSTSTFSLHQITQADAFHFDATDYSRFKFGDADIAALYGTALAEAFIAQRLSISIPANQLVVLSSPYAYIPTATYAMKDHFVYTLNQFLQQNNLPACQQAKVNRTITYKDDYGALNAQERMQLIGNDSFYIDKPYLEGKTLIFLDDIRITGSHERMILKMVAEYELKNEIFMLYFAELTNHSIHPNIENTLNYAAVNSIFDLNSIIKCGNFAINTRIVKYILHSAEDSFLVFIDAQENSFKELLYQMALGNNYHQIEAYQTNLNHLADRLNKQNNKILTYN